ncbi:MAG: glycosyltransferase [Burkholderiaceae bacterium]|nr:glycosyltransferase [Burkholderiaceae bacterium]
MLTSVIIPTTCDPKRFPFLLRSIASLKQQNAVVEIIVVANGPRVDEQCLAAVQADNGVSKVVRLAEGNVSLARFAGLQAATGDFFCFLDDDDEILPNGIASRLAAFGSDVDVLITNGYIHNGGDTLDVPNEFVTAIERDQIGSFLTFNWISSPSPTYRTKSVNKELFRIQHKYFELSYLFFLLQAQKYKIDFRNVLTYRKYEDNPLSVSKSREYQQAYTIFLKDILREKAKFHLQPQHTTQIKRKLAAAYNHQSLLDLRHGYRMKAWRSHIKCLLSGGYHYLPYTRKLFFRSE